jgi:hypothetical protein
MFAKLMTKLAALEARVQLATGKFREKLLKKIAKLRARLGLGTASEVATAVAVATIAVAVATSVPAPDSAGDQLTDTAAQSADPPSIATPTESNVAAGHAAAGLAKGRPAVRTVIDAPLDSTNPTTADTSEALVSTSSSGSLDEVTLALEPDASADSDSEMTADSPTASTETPAAASDASATESEPTPVAADDAPTSTDAADPAETTADAPSTSDDASPTSHSSIASESPTTTDGPVADDAQTAPTTASAAVATPSPSSTSSNAQPGSSLGSGSAPYSLAAANGIMRVEEDWELVVNEPDKLVAAPQLGTVMTPLKDIEDVYLAFALNHRINPIYTTGGMELQLWYNGAQIGWLSLGNAHLGTKGEKVTWTQRLELKNGRLRFVIADGSSSTWGNFGQGDSIHLSVKTNLSDLNNYNPQVTVANSGVTFASNRVASLVLKAVRAYDSHGQLVTSQSTPVSVFVLRN